MNDFEEIRFPDGISYGSSGGPEFSTDVVVSQSGYEQRNINWDEARCRYNVSHGVKNSEQLDSLISFFRARKGRAIGFRFKDWSDYSASAVEIGTGDGSENEFNLVKLYKSGNFSYSRGIYKPVLGDVRVEIDGTNIDTSVYSVDYTNGEVRIHTNVTDSINIFVNGNNIITIDIKADVDKFFTDSNNSDIVIVEKLKGSVSLYLNGVVYENYIVNFTTGVVTLDSVPNSGVIITADFEFDVPARFDTDILSSSMDSYGTNSWRNIRIVELKI